MGFFAIYLIYDRISIVEENSKQIPAENVSGEYPPIKIPQEVRAAFLKKWQGYRYTDGTDVVAKINPDELMVVIVEPSVEALKDQIPFGHNVIREFYSWNPADREFYSTAQLILDKEENKYYPSSITLEGEQGIETREPDSLQILFSSSSSLECFFGLNGRRLDIRYFRNKLVNVEIGDVDDDNSHYNLWVRRLPKTGSRSTRLKGGRRVEINATVDSLVLKRFKGLDIEDEILLPRQIDQDKLIQDLIDPAILENPINATPDNDEPWRFANILDAGGVKWQRF